MNDTGLSEELGTIRPGGRPQTNNKRGLCRLTPINTHKTSSIPLSSFPSLCASLCAVCSRVHIRGHMCGGLHMCEWPGARACGSPTLMSGTILYRPST